MGQDGDAGLDGCDGGVAEGMRRKLWDGVSKGPWPQRAEVEKETNQKPMHGAGV